MIGETPEQLKRIQTEQKDVSNFQKVQGLYLLKTGRVKTVSSLADSLGVHRVTIQRWLRNYCHQGLAELLRVKPKTGGKKTIEGHVIAQLKERLNQPEQGFRSYREIQDWLEKTDQIQINYYTVYYWVRYKLKAKLKVPRITAAKKNEQEAENFKKKLPKLLQVVQCWNN